MCVREDMAKEPKKRNVKVTNSKNRGREFTKRIRALFIECFGLEEDDIRIATGYEQGCDIKYNNKAARAKLGISTECKNQKQISLGSWLTQAITNTEEGTVPFLVFHKPVSSRRDIPGEKVIHNFAVMPLSHYLELREKLLKYEE
jgi:hypothetical protein